MSKNEEISIDTIKAILEDIRLSLKVQRNEIMNIEECALYLGLETTMLIKYVHELQHALRLCGLNDLANDFKI